MADNLIPAANGKDRNGFNKPLSSLQRKAEASASTFSADNLANTTASKPAASVKPSSNPQASNRAAQAVLSDVQLAEDMQPTKLESFGATFGGITRDLWVAGMAKTGKEELDPKWDVGSKREHFRKHYSPNMWDAFENTKNEEQYNALVENEEAEGQRQRVAGSNFWSGMAGQIFDPIGLLTGGTYLKSAQAISKAYGIGKYASLAGSSLAEGGTYAGVEALKQNSLYGEVVDAQAVGATFLWSSAMIFGVSAATMRKSAFTKGAGGTNADTAIGQPSPNIAQAAAVDSTASDLILSGRQGLADAAAADAKKVIEQGQPLSTKVADELTVAVPPKPVAPEGAWFTGTTGEMTATRSLASQIARQSAKGTGDKATEDFAGAGNYIAMDAKFSETYAKNGNIYSIEKPFDNPFDLNAKGNSKVYKDLTKQAGSKSAANKLLQEQGYDAITFTDPRGNKLANMFNEKPVAFYKKGRTASKKKVQLELEPIDGAVVPTKVESGIADAGSAANTGRQAVQEGLSIDSASDAILDIQDLASVNIAAKRDELGKDFDFVKTPIGKVSALFSNFHRGMQSASDVVKNFVLATAEDGTGVYRKATTGTAIDKHRFNKLIRDGYSDVHTEFAGWAKRQGETFTAGRLTGKAEEAFNKLLRNEMEARDRLNGLTKQEVDAADAERWLNTAKEVRRAADHLDRGNDVAVDLLIRSGVQGAEQLKGRRGYVPRRMNGEKLAELARTDNKRFKLLKDTYAKRMLESLLEKQKELIAQGEKGIRLMTLSKATTIADGMFDRAIKRAAGLEQSSIALFDRAARDEIEAILKSGGADDTEVRYLFDLLDKKLGTGTASNRLKGRIDIDIHTPDEASGINFTDYYDNDLNKLFSSYAEEMSGRAALARTGIMNDNDFSNIVNAAVNQGANAEDVKVMQDIYSQMLGRPLPNQNRNKFVHLMMQVNPLQTLGQVGFAQASESSLSLARLGVGTVLKSIPVLAKLAVGIRKGILSESDTALIKDIELFNGPVGEEWRLFKPSSDVMENLNASGEIARVSDRLLKAGQHINGYISFMHQVMEAQLKTIAVGATRRFAQEIKAGKLTDRLADAGFTEGSIKTIKAQFDAHAEFKGGDLVAMNLKAWDADAAFQFTRNIERLSGQLIQRDFVGETASWMHGDIGRMFLSLRGYSVKAFNKQLVRNVKIADAVTAQAFIYGAAFSTASYMAKAHIASLGRDDREEFLEDRLSGNNMAMGVIGYMGLGAFGTELIRPLASWAGESGDAGAIRSGGNAVVAALPGLAPLDRAITLAGNVGTSFSSYVKGDDKNDWTAARTRQAVGFFGGNSLLVALPLNYAVDDDE